MSLPPLTVPEARAILAADEALDRTFKERQESEQLLSSAESEAWMRIVQSANARVESYEGAKGDTPNKFMGAVASHRAEAWTGYTIKRLTADDAAHVAELLDASIDDEHYLTWHPKLRKIREKMIETY